MMDRRIFQEETMSTLPAETAVSGECPVCAARLFRPSSIEETEILTCDECRSVLVVERRVDGLVILGAAPRIEEDWGQ